MSALTNVKLTAATIAQETTVPGTAGVLTRNASIEVDHAFRRWLVGAIKFSYGFDDYVGSDRKDDRYAVSAAITYKLNRADEIGRAHVWTPVTPISRMTASSLPQ